MEGSSLFMFWLDPGRYHISFLSTFPLIPCVTSVICKLLFLGMRRKHSELISTIDRVLIRIELNTTCEVTDYL